MRLQLIAAATTLTAAAIAFAEPDDTQVASDLLVYTDNDNVVVVSPQVSARQKLDDEGGEVSARYVLDAISAASADVVSSATYRFSELRNEVGLGLSKAQGDWLPAITYRFSHEPDYVSHGFTAGLNRRFAGGDTTASATFGFVADTIGRVDTPRDAFAEQLVIQTAEASLAQNVDAKTIVRLVYSLTYQNGFMEKPYRSVPLFTDAGLMAAAEAGGLDGDNYDLFRSAARPLEEVPDTRWRHALAARGLRYIEPLSMALKLDYRFYFDSWGITAHTLEPAAYIELSEKWRLDAWSRFHFQGAADFWRRAYRIDSETQIPALRTSDRSLSRSWHLTGGARIARSTETLNTYFELSTMYSDFSDFLFLDTRTAIIGQSGVRWRF